MTVRADGRGPLDVRAPSVVTGIIANANGSACVEVGGNKVICSIRGPLQLTTEYRGNKGKITCNISYAPFASRGPRIDPQAGARGGVSSEKELAFVLEGICEQVVVLESFPQLCYELNFIVLSSEGGDDLPALCSSACAALMEAGVEMTDVFSASSSALCPSPEAIEEENDSTNNALTTSIVVDPTPAERTVAPAVCVVAAATTTGKTLYYSHEGAARPVVIAELFKHAVAGCHSHRKHITEAFK